MSLIISLIFLKIFRKVKLASSLLPLFHWYPESVRFWKHNVPSFKRKKENLDALKYNTTGIVFWFSLRILWTILSFFWHICLCLAKLNSSCSWKLISFLSGSVESDFILFLWVFCLPICVCFCSNRAWEVLDFLILRL